MLDTKQFHSRHISDIKQEDGSHGQIHEDSKSLDLSHDDLSGQASGGANRPNRAARYGAGKALLEPTASDDGGKADQPLSHFTLIE